MNSLMIREKAVNIFNRLKEQASAIDKKDTFSASKEWFQNFRKRYSLRNLKFKGEAASSDKAAAENFLPNITEIIEENGYVPDQVFNTDETALFWKKIPDRTFVTQNVQDVSGFKVNKDRVTLLLCCNASGDHMMKPLLINRALRPRAMKRTVLSELPVHWVANKKAWMTAQDFRNWFHKCFVVETEKYMEKKGLPFKILLILDNAPCHPLNLEHPNVKVVFLPPNTTTLIQPLDQGIIATFKINYIKRTFNDIFNKLENDESLTISEASKQYNILNCVKNIALALRDIKHSPLNVCWKAIWPQVVAPGNTVPTTEEGISSIITLSQRFEKEGISNLNECNFNELLVDRELTDIDLIHIISETQPNDECDSDYEETNSFTAENLCKALELAKKLESAIIDNDPNIQRALKFRQDLIKCCSEYQQIYENLVKEKTENKSSEKININNKNDVELTNISSDADDTFVPIKRKRLIVLNYSSDSDTE